MPDNEKPLFLILGCWGRKDNGFITCSSVVNPILEINNSLEQFDDIIKFLKYSSLLEKRIMDYNAVRNIIFRMQKTFARGHKNLWDDNIFRLIENFTIVHKPCGVYLVLDFMDRPKLPSKDRIVTIEPNKPIIRNTI